MQDVDQHGASGSRLALAHRRKDVHLINQSIRSAYQKAGFLKDGIKIKTNHGPREFCVGERIVLTRNDRDLNVRNGMLGAVTSIENETLAITIDDGDKSARSINLNLYTAIDHGYAITIHKSQGATVDKCFVLASKTMDRHLTYVSMTRHKADAKFYMTDQSQRSLRHKKVNVKQDLIQANFGPVRI